ncbi:EscE/YscE/SsaE family type III secretion system needle protein co-chaperone [Endozoicomonas sp.]|uniref:EscE/YscE/SsaE family type III secretion system needle protein co-chaperone n=1 Tax=Endozoicomonas sp. TaxID=1892382 RepID=UPI003AF5FCAE
MTDKTTNDEKIHLSTIEEQLIDDKTGTYRDQLLGQLFSEATRLKGLKDQGAAPEDFSKIDSLLTAVVAAMEVVDKSWKQHHGQSKA